MPDNKQDDVQASNADPHLTIDIKDPQPDGPPPPFAPYEPEFFVSSHGDIISHDHHLNEDGEALYRFLLDQSEKPPSYLLTISGTHAERRTRTHTRTVNGVQEVRTETYTVTITDFDFSIDLTDYLVVGPAYWSHPDETATYRGLLVRQIMTPEAGRITATKEEVTAFKTDECAHIEVGVPPWQALDGSIRSKNQASSKTLREWADEYASSPKLLKEFLFKKTVYGWNTAKLTTAIESAIVQTGYSGSIDISFMLSGNKICIRPDNRLSRMLSSTLYKVLLSICLVYPFIWLFKRFGARGGGRWEVYGAAYGLKYFESVADGEDLSGYLPVGSEGARGKPRLVQTEEGTKKVIGHREGEWFREWEPVIKRSAAMRVRRDEPMRRVQDGPDDPAHALEGYIPGLEGY